MRIIKYISITILTIALFLIFSKQEKTGYVILHGETMGTFYNIKIRQEEQQIPSDLQDRIDKELAEINRQMSVFIEDSEINQINKLRHGKELHISQEMTDLLLSAQEIHQESRGLFDPTTAPLIELWGFGVQDITKLPTKQKIAQTLKHIGLSKLKINKDKQTISKQDSLLSLNLSAIAKGYGVDRIAKLLDDMEINNYIVEIGGEIRCRGTRTKSGEKWHISLTAPIGNGEGTAYVLDLSDISVATSGNYRNYHQSGDKRLSHTISPLTGRPIDNQMVSATIIAPNCMEADAYATAMMLLGPKEGLQLAERKKLGAILMTQDADGKIKKYVSTQAKQYIRQ